jgi:hypothetical protein
MPLKSAKVYTRGDTIITVIGDDHNEDIHAPEPEEHRFVYLKAEAVLQAHGQVLLELAEFYLSHPQYRNAAANGSICAYYSVPFAHAGRNGVHVFDDRCSSTRTPISSWVQQSKDPSHTVRRLICPPVRVHCCPFFTPSICIINFISFALGGTLMIE